MLEAHRTTAAQPEPASTRADTQLDISLAHALLQLILSCTQSTQPSAACAQRCLSCYACLVSACWRVSPAVSSEAPGACHARHLLVTCWPYCAVFSYVISCRLCLRIPTMVFSHISSADQLGDETSAVQANTPKNSVGVHSCFRGLSPPSGPSTRGAEDASE